MDDQAPDALPTEPVHVELAQDRRAPADARRAAREALVRWRLPGLVDAVVLAVSELVTNAVRYGRPQVSLELWRQPEQVRVSVHDGDPTEPPTGGGEAGPDAESGRGLSIVQQLADEVAVEQVPDDGKIVRVSFDVSPVEEQPEGAPER
jgi:anti-sigma regulatory factor (Ser/Thr protein kinase)